MKWSWLSGWFSPITQWLKNRGDIARAEHNRDLSIINNQARLAQSQTDYNHEWEMASLKDKDKALRHFSYAMFTAPILITVVNPEQGAIIFENLELVPDWLVKTWIALNGGVWGISTLKNIVPSFIGQMKKRV